jgi:hypothetical protein
MYSESHATCSSNACLISTSKATAFRQQQLFMTALRYPAHPILTNTSIACIVCPADYLKISHPLGWGVSNLILSMVEFKSAYDAAGTWTQAVRNMKWATDWLIKAHVKASDNPRDNVFIGQVCGTARTAKEQQLMMQVLSSWAPPATAVLHSRNSNMCALCMVSNLHMSARSWHV